MLPRQQRLTRAGDFRRVYGARRRRSGTLLDVLTVPNALGQARVGFSVSTKVGGSVRRNLVRRRLREIVRERLRGWAGSLDIVVVARPGAAQAEFADLSLELNRLLDLALAVPPPGRPRPDGNL